MQLKTLTVFAASLALAQAKVNGTWGDHPKAPVLDTTSSPSATKPVELPTGKPEKPVDGGKTDVADTTAEETSTWSEIDFPESTETPVDGGKTDVADETASSTASYWGDISVPVEGGSTDVADETASSTASYWGDVSVPVDGGKTSSSVADTTVTDTPTWGDHTSFPEQTPTSTPVSGDEGKPPGGGQGKPPGGPPSPPSGGEGKPPGGGQGQPPAPPSGGEGKPPGGGQGQPPAGGPPAAPGGGAGKPPVGGQCGVVTTTTTKVVTVTVPAGGQQQPTKPAPPAETTETFSATWQDQTTGFQTSAAPVPTQGGYMGVVAEWRSKMGLSPLELDSKLQNNAQDAANSSGGQLKHKLNSGSMAQVMAPGDSGNFEDVFVGGWLCELPNTPGLGQGVCKEASKGWNYAGQTGHAEILISGKYSKIGCGLGQGIWCCDLA